MHKFSVENGKTMLDGRPFLARGLRCSNGLYSEETTNELVEQLKIYTCHGLRLIPEFDGGQNISRNITENIKYEDAFAQQFCISLCRRFQGFYAG